MKISILGCGWLGLPLGKSLLEAGHFVLGSTTQESKLAILREAGIEPFRIDLSAPLISSSGSFFNSDVLVITFPPNRKAGKTDEYLSQLRSLVQVIRSGLTRHIIFVSSTSVYADTNDVVYEGDESPDSYMVQAEHLVREEPFRTTVIRLGGLFGPDRHPGRFLAGKIDVAGGDAPVNMIHRDDAVGIISRVIEEQSWNEVFNACADQHPTRSEFYTRMSLNANLVPPVFSPDATRSFKIVSSQKMKDRLQYTFKVPDPLHWSG